MDTGICFWGFDHAKVGSVILNQAQIKGGGLYTPLRARVADQDLSE